MPQLPIELKYSHLLGLPVVSTLIYTLQIWLVKRQLARSVWVSRRQSKKRAELFNLLLLSKGPLICSAWQLGQQIRELKNMYFFHFSQQSLKNFTHSELYDLQWCLLFAKGITDRSQAALKPLLPSHYPISHLYLITAENRLNSGADFIRQTILQLHQRSQFVHLISHFELPKQELSQLESSLPNSPHQKASDSFLPFRLRSLVMRIRQMNTARLLRKYDRFFFPPVFWCFDPLDYDLLPVCPPNTTIYYDNVDHITSLDKQVDKHLNTLHQRLLRTADIVTANSRTLFSLIKKERKDVTLVPQGFDELSFRRKNTVHQKITKKICQKLAQIKKRGTTIAIYSGLLSFRVDYKLLFAVIADLPDITFCLPQTVLPWQSEDAVYAWKRWIPKLKKLRNIIWYPQLDRTELAQILYCADIGLIPYDTSFHHNTYSFPMKSIEYMYCGLPILSTKISELRFYKHAITCTNTAKGWKEFLQSFCSPTKQQKELLKQQALQHSWERKIDIITRKLELFRSAAT